MIVAVASGKGGVGKTTVSLNIGALHDAVIVDADLGMADLPTGHGPDLHDVLAGRVTPSRAVQEHGAVTILPCGRSLAGTHASDPTALVDVLTRLDDQYGTVLVDCPAGLAADVGLPLFAADRCIIVTTPDTGAVPNAIRTRALARVFETGIEQVVVNKAGPDPPAADIRQTIGAPVTVIEANDRIQDTQQAGRPVVTASPESAPAQQFQELATAITSM